MALTQSIAEGTMGSRSMIFRRINFLDISNLRIGGVPGRWEGGAGIVLTAPFFPVVFQGEEFAASTPFLYFADHEDPEMARAVKEGRRGEFAAFGWDPTDIPDPEAVETFRRSKLNWGEVHEGE